MSSVAFFRWQGKGMSQGMTEHFPKQKASREPINRLSPINSLVESWTDREADFHQPRQHFWEMFVAKEVKFLDTRVGFFNFCGNSS